MATIGNCRDSVNAARGHPLALPSQQGTWAVGACLPTVWLATRRGEFE
jgi:hypothetical protein